MIKVKDLCKRLFIHQIQLNKKILYSFSLQKQQSKMSKSLLFQITNNYKINPSFLTFKSYLQNQSINCFQIYNITKKQPYSPIFYPQFLQYLNATNKKQHNDNFYLLKSKVNYQIGLYHQLLKQYKQAKDKLLQCLQILQQSVVPPILIYHQIYRRYGMILYKLKQYKQSLQVLSQCTSIISKLIQQSEDEVSQNNMDQAIAYTYLLDIARIQSSKQKQNQHQNQIKKFLQLGDAQWKNIYDRYQNSQYCLFILNKAIFLNQNKKSIEAIDIIQKQIKLFTNKDNNTLQLENLYLKLIKKKYDLGPPSDNDFTLDL